MTTKTPSLKSIQQVAKKLFEHESAQEQFIDSILNPTPKPTALIWMNEPVSYSELKFLSSPSNFPSWISLIDPECSPGKLPAHENGEFYCLDPSSVLAVIPLLEIKSLLPEPLNIIDLCASPGGKSIFAYRAISPDFLLANEVIGKRVPALLTNLKRCKLKNTVATKADPSLLSKFNTNTASLVIVDAPCSGQSLLAKDEKALGCFSKPVINANVGRQRRILAEASKLARSAGFILYSTCTFSIEENEGNIKWFLKKFPEFSKISEGRVFPADGLGAGSYSCLLRKDESLKTTEYSIDLSEIQNWPIFE